MTAAPRDRHTVAIEIGDGLGGGEVTVLADGEEVWRRAIEPNYSSTILGVVQVTGAQVVEVRAGGMTARHRPGAHEHRLRADIDAEGRLTLGPAPEDPTF